MTKTRYLRPSMDNSGHLDSIAMTYSEDIGFESTLMEYKINEVRKFIQGKTMLDIGCGVGTLTRALAGDFEQVVGIDGSVVKIQKAEEKNNSKNIEYKQYLIENFIPSTQFDFIVSTNVLEHVVDTAIFLAQVKQMLAGDGKVVMTVPNALGLHKRIGKHMGVIDDFYRLTPADLEKGHKRVYDMEILENEFRKAGFNPVHIGGILLKPLSHRQMETWDRKIVDALYEVGKELPGYCSSLLIAATH
ncbi:MAG: class I SAM-dependent methyltransferase [Desulfosalsimonadaceae bacterium]